LSDTRIQLELRELEFPVLLVTERWIRVYLDVEAATAVWKKAIDRRAFDGGLLVDSSGRARRINTVRPLGSIGWFGGFDVFLNRSMRIEYVFAGGWEAADLGALRTRALRQWHKLQDADPHYERKYDSALAGARDVRTLIRVLAEQYSGSFERTR
jgi:hypothetical protein